MNNENKYKTPPVETGRAPSNEPLMHCRDAIHRV